MVSVSKVVALALLCAASACGGAAAGPETTAVPLPASTVVTTSVPVAGIDVVTAAERYGLPDAVRATVAAPELGMVLNLAVEPSMSSTTDVSLFGRFASCSIIEGKNWLPFEVVVAEGHGGPALRLVDASGNADPVGSVDVRIRIDDGDGRVIEAVGGAVVTDDGRSGTWSGRTVDGATVSGTYTCEGAHRADQLAQPAAEISARIVDTATGTIRTVGARSGPDAVCAIGGSAGLVLQIVDAEEPAGGLVSLTIETERAIPIGSIGVGSLVMTVPGGGMRFSTVEVRRVNGGGVISGEDGAGRRIDAAWSCA